MMIPIPEPLKNTLTRPVSDRVLRLLVPLIVLFSLSVTLFSQARFAADTYVYNVTTFTSMAGGMDSYRRTLRQEWRPRLFTNWLAARFVRLDSSLPAKTVDAERACWKISAGPDPLFLNKEEYRSAVGRWVVFWFFLSGIVFIAMRLERALLYLFGSYAAISMAYSPGVAFPEIIQIYPWDMPAFFFFALFLFLVETKRWRHLFWMIPLAVGFKETAILLCIAFLFCNAKSWRHRILNFSVSLLLCLLVKAGIGLLTNPEQFLFTMTSRERPDEPLRLGANLFYILRYKWPATPLLVNAGTLMALFLLPALNRKVWMIKTIAFLFVGGIAVYGLINEFRIFFEMIPLALYGLDVWHLDLYKKRSLSAW